MTGPHSPERVETIVEKIEYVERCIEILAAKQSISEQSFGRDVDTRDAVERRFEKAPGACLDVARMILKDVDGEAPESNAATMEQLGDVGVLAAETAEEMAEAALFRNVLAHEYGEVLDQDLVYEALQDLSRYRRFLHDVRDHHQRVDAI